MPLTTQEELLGAGFAYPGKIDTATGGLAAARGVDSVRASLRRLFDTAPGEQLFVPEYGSVLKYLVFENDVGLFRAMCLVAVTETIKQWEPRVAAILDIVLDADAASEGSTTVTMKLTVQLVDGRVVDGIMYSFPSA